MPYRDRERLRAYQSAWIAKRRAEWLSHRGPCSLCGSPDRLEVHHADPSEKVSHRLWSWAEPRLELFHQDGRSAGIWYCPNCRAVLRSSDDSCCRERTCACGTPTGSRYASQCDKCRKEVEWKAAEKRLAEAQEISVDGYTDWVYCDGYFHKHGFFESLDELAEWLDENHDPEEMGPRPEWAYACYPQPPRRVDIGDVLEDMFSDSFEEADEQAVEEDALSAALDAFWESNKNIVSWTPDYKRKIRVPEVSQ